MCKVSDMQFHYACHAKCVMCEKIDICLNSRYVVICTYDYKRYGISHDINSNCLKLKKMHFYVIDNQGEYYLKKFSNIYE